MFKRGNSKDEEHEQDEEEMWMDGVMSYYATTESADPCDTHTVEPISSSSSTQSSSSSKSSFASSESFSSSRLSSS